LRGTVAEEHSRAHRRCVTEPISNATLEGGAIFQDTKKADSNTQSPHKALQKGIRIQPKACNQSKQNLHQKNPYGARDAHWNEPAPPRANAAPQVSPDSCRVRATELRCCTDKQRKLSTAPTPTSIEPCVPHRSSGWWRDDGSLAVLMCIPAQGISVHRGAFEELAREHIEDC
jgi:hypothetical protein